MFFSSLNLPIPATYVIAQDGTVHAAWVDPDWRHRVEPSDILASLMEIPSVRISALQARVATLEGHVKALLETKGICTKLVPF